MAKIYHCWYSETAANQPGIGRCIYRLEDGTEVTTTLVTEAEKCLPTYYADVQYLGRGVFVRVLPTNNSGWLMDETRSMGENRR